MRRSLRLAICAAGMLAAAVCACIILQDKEAETYVGQHEVAGRIGGLTAHQVNAVHAVHPVPAKTEAPAANTANADKARALDSAKVQVLALAKAAAEKREVPGGIAEEVAPRPEALVPAPEKPVVEKAVPAPEAVKAPVVTEAPKAPTKVKDVEAKKVEAKETEDKKAEKKPAFRKFDDAAIKVDAKAEAKAAKVAALKAEAKKAPPKKVVPQLSPVESALADVRAGRLAPVKGGLVEEKKRTYDRVVTSAKFSMQGSLIKLVLKGNAPMVGHYYVLESPDRVVLDLAGNWDVEIPKVPSNRLIASVRVGQHDDKTRLVFDMKTTGKVALVPLNRNALELRIR